MPPYDHQLFVDRYAPDGTVRSQDENIASAGGEYGFFGAKWIDHDTHAVVKGGATNRVFEVTRRHAIDAAGNTILDNSLVLTQTLQGIAKLMQPDGKQEVYFLDTATTPDDLYRIRLDTEAAPSAIVVGVGPSGDRWGLCWMDHEWAHVTAPGTTNNYIDRSRLEASALVVKGNITTRAAWTGQHAKGIAWNGRDVAVVSEDATATPPSNYRLDLFRPHVQVVASRTLATRGSFPQGFGGVVDVDWDGREWLVYHVQVVDLGT